MPSYAGAVCAPPTQQMHCNHTVCPTSARSPIILLVPQCACATLTLRRFQFRAFSDIDLQGQVMARAREWGGRGNQGGAGKHTAINRIQIRVLALSVCHINMAGRQREGVSGGRWLATGNCDGTWPRPPNDQPACCSLKWNLIGF